MPWRLPLEWDAESNEGSEASVATVATGSGKRGWKLLILKGRCMRVPPTPVFWKKRLDLLDNKGVDFFGDDKEAARD